ncbi:MAG: hypothetical protein ACREPM_06500 [Gemmatimonadaceae bacterium]
MTIQVRIEFSGLCLFVHQRKQNRVSVVMPDARMPANGATIVHRDHSHAVPHAGYLRFDLADLDHAFPAAANDYAGPNFEVIHRFDREELHLGLAKTAAHVGVTELALPNFKQVESELKIRPDLFGDSPPPLLLMRTALLGGEFTSHSGGSNWKFPTTANGKRAYQGQFASTSVWTGEVGGNELTLTLQPFDGRPATTFALRPKDGKMVRLKIVNLCAENPLEWPELKIRAMDGDEDKDFKWLYRMLDNPELVLEDHQGNPQSFPVPVLDRSNMVEGEDRDCTGGQIDDP